MQPDDFLAWVLSEIKPLKPETKVLGEAHSFVLHSAAHALIDLPLADASAMDGFALKSSDTVGASSEHHVSFEVVAEVAAGSSLDPQLQDFEVARIMTGAVLPSDADAVVPIENTVAGLENGWESQRVALQHEIVAGANVRRRAEDVRRGDVIAKPGSQLSAALVSALKAAAVTEVSVFSKPKIAILSTGAELLSEIADTPLAEPLTLTSAHSDTHSGTHSEELIAEPAAEPAAGLSSREIGLSRGQIPESNSHLLSGMLREAGFQAETVFTVNDDIDALKVKITELASEYDAIISTGGVGPGKHDVVRLALAEQKNIRALKVKMRPGQPQCAGRHERGAFFFGLPGNPVSAAASFELFVRPALRKMAGFERLKKRTHLAKLKTALRVKPGALNVIPIRFFEESGELFCEPVITRSGVSHSVASFGRSEGLALISGDAVATDPATINAATVGAAVLGEATLGVAGVGDAAVGESTVGVAAVAESAVGDATVGAGTVEAGAFVPTIEIGLP